LKTLEGVQIAISLVYCLVRCLFYYPDESELQRLYDKANLVVYGLVGMVSGILGIVSIKTNLLSCFQTGIQKKLCFSNKAGSSLHYKAVPYLDSKRKFVKLYLYFFLKVRYVARQALQTQGY
jgi:hypothetical protein